MPDGVARDPLLDPDTTRADSERELQLPQEVSPASNGILGSKPLFRLLVAATATLAFVWSAGHSDLHWRSVVDALRSIPQASLLVAVGCTLLQVCCQTARFAVLVPTSLEVGWLRAFRVTAVGQVLNVVLPARGGDLYKALVLCPGRRGARTSALGVVAADKAADILGLSLVVFLLGLGPALHWLSALQGNGAWLGFAAALGVVLWFLVVKWRSARFVRQAGTRLAHFGAGLASLRNPRRALAAVSLGAAAWLAEAATLVALAHGAGGSVSLSQAMLALLALNVGIAVPLLPANLGAFEAGVAFGLHHAGLPPSSAVAIAFAHHGIQLALTTTWGGAVMVVHAALHARSQSVFQVQQPDKVRALSHYERSSGHYESTVKRGPLRFMRDRERASVLHLLGPLHAGETFLDVGCGGGFYALEAKRASMLVCAVDAASGMIERLAPQVDEALVRDVETLHLGGRTFDRVVCAGVMDFVENPDAAMVNLMRHVAPGGVLVILAPRTGVQGCYYRLEKFAVGLRVNLFTSKWFSTIAAHHHFHVASVELPLPHNLVVRLEPMPTP
jgi:uncharacterized membrane protein YbhN (UPF0104 family)/2-polyprenyl-3-methyl-5-hydroxy-6-metoxy-1,4-benzoquinol methylase